MITYRQLLKKRAQKVKGLEKLLQKSIIRGSIRVQGNRCGGKNCRCKRKDNPILHGPYPYLSYRGKKSNHSILLGKSKKHHAEKAIKAYKDVMNNIIDLSEINFKILRYYYNKI